MPEQDMPARTLRLHRCGARDSGNALGLRRGDVLVGLDGAAWRGSPDAFRARFSAAGQPIALTFRRGDSHFTVLADRPDLGPWESVPADAAPAALPAGVERLCNWEILVHPDGSHDLVALRPSLLALLAPLLWLAQMRLWTLSATLAAGMAVALPGGALLVAGVWIASGLHLWRTGDKHLRAARLAEGYRKVGVIAAMHEDEARVAWTALEPDARFRFDRKPARDTAPAETRPAAV